jgi:hypothetical protein
LKTKQAWGQWTAPADSKKGQKWGEGEGELGILDDYEHKAGLQRLAARKDNRGLVSGITFEDKAGNSPSKVPSSNPRRFHTQSRLVDRAIDHQCAHSLMHVSKSCTTLRAGIVQQIDCTDHWNDLVQFS